MPGGQHGGMAREVCHLGGICVIAYRLEGDNSRLAGRAVAAGAGLGGGATCWVSLHVCLWVVVLDYDALINLTSF